MAEIFKRIDLCRNWQFRQADDDEDEEKGSAWMPVDRVPTNVHLDLLANGKYVVLLGLFALKAELLSRERLK